MEKQELFDALIESIERYHVDNSFYLKREMPDIIDVFDIMLSSKFRKMKCVLHPSLNALVYQGIIVSGSAITVKQYLLHNENGLDPVRILKEFSLLEYEGKTVNILNKNHNFFNGNYKRNCGLLSRRGYYLPLWNNEDYYGNTWKISKKKMNSYKLESFSKHIKLKDIEKHLSSTPAVYGTVVIKSRLTHFAKSESNSKYPYTFSIEIEDDNCTCSVTFWNKACIDYFLSIEIGQVVILRNYKVKKRYGARSNTVYGGSKSLEYELSINANARKKGEVDLLDVAPCSVQFRYNAQI